MFVQCHYNEIRDIVMCTLFLKLTKKMTNVFIFLFQERNPSSANTLAVTGDSRIAVIEKNTVTSIRQTNLTIVEFPAAISPTPILAHCANT